MIVRNASLCSLNASEDKFKLSLISRICIAYNKAKTSKLFQIASNIYLASIVPGAPKRARRMCILDVYCLHNLVDKGPSYFTSLSLMLCLLPLFVLEGGGRRVAKSNFFVTPEILGIKI